METLTAPRIERANHTHLQAITALAQSWLIDTAAKGVSSQGFLMEPWQLEDYHAYLNEAEHFSVAIHGTELVGFSIAYGHHHVHFDPRIHAAIAPHVAEYVYYEQLCIAPEWAHQGVGSALMSQLLESSSPLPVVDEIARYPLNSASVNLHIKFGFKPLFDLTRHDGIITTIWILEPRGAAEAS